MNPPTHQASQSSNLAAPTPPGLAQQIHVVLVEPGNSLNIGACARAMSNLGFDQLHLVSPPRLDLAQAKKAACWAAPLLDKAMVHHSLFAALAAMQLVVGFTARHGRNRPQHWLLPAWGTQWHHAPPQKTALLFGSEDHGLQQEHLECCHQLVRIPSVADNPSYNLAQAVLLVLFEISRTSTLLTENPQQPEARSPLTMSPVPMGALEALDKLLARVLWLSGFYARGTPRPIPGLVRRMLRRLQPNQRELGWLLGILGRIEGTLSQRLPVARGKPLPTTLPRQAPDNSCHNLDKT